MPDQSSPPPAPQAKPQRKTLMAVLAYLGILIIIPFLMAKDDPFVTFHLKQGLLLVIVEVGVWVLGMTMLGWQLWQLLQLINLAAIIFSIIGIVYVIQGKEKELPFIGSLAKNFTF
ncbi:hypothetical protein COU18_00775 [Candidatus Kaiserbacteria bacterium CG10_big_fil_rev_8_21_14_0_10_51_14]|uniref:DUF4870 domain-containing protein n=1 Tax=Candidatus Kaiserbacteria bacterium CG10_big_fil_rev_8_21_14_0_10_51_14 TaxID=1974610 RepID=A0A2H0UC17_9BACT|nr:MAG: hypothetical protein COU18_00775 [Candidatus Kaiserbacteria bacterium CG10_big_fil_rev_8_21_14_0_10_51_14]